MAKPGSQQSRVQPAPREAPLTWPSPAVAAAIYFGLSLLYFLPAFLPGRHIYGTDYLGGGYFFYHFISERLAAGDLPKWVPYIFGGLPLFANPGSTYQPAHFLADLLLPITRVLPAVFVVHFWLAGLGMYLLARELGCRRWVAFLSGLAFQFTGILTSWVYAGHDGRIIVATVAPLLFYFLHRAVRLVEPVSFAGVAGTLALALLSFQIQNSYYLLLAGGIWAVFLLVHFGVHRRGALLARVVAMGIGAVAFGFVLAAVNFLPFRSYVPESPRGMEGGRGYEYSVSFSMPVPEVLSVAVPEQHGASVADPNTGRPLFPEYTGRNPFKLHTEYAGALVMVLLLLGGYYARRDRTWQFFAGLGLFMLTIALGGNTPLYRLYYAVLPGTQQFRAPSLSFFVVAMAMVAMAAITLEQLARRREAERPAAAASAGGDTATPVLWMGGGLAAAAFLGMAFASAEATAPGAPSVAAGWGRFALYAAVVTFFLWRWAGQRLGSTLLVAVLAFVTLADLWTMGRRFFHTVDPPGVTFAADDVMQFLMRQQQPVRMWTFPAPEHYRGAGAYGGNYPMLFGIEQVGGEHPNMLQRWNEFVGAGTQTYIDWHNLVVEAGVVNHPDGYQAIAFRAQPGFLEAAAVSHIVSMAPLYHPDLREVHRGSALVYENAAARPRAWLVPDARAVPSDAMLDSMRAGEWDPARVAFLPAPAPSALGTGPLEGEARVVTHTPDRVVVRSNASRPALLVLADNWYPGWIARVDGAELEVLRVNHTFRGVVVPPGDRELVFEFRPGSFFTGLWITVGAFLVLLVFLATALLLARRRRASPTPAE